MSKKAQAIEWIAGQVALKDLIKWKVNPRKITNSHKTRLGASIQEFGQAKVILVSPSNEIYDGHQRAQVLLEQYGENYVVHVRRASRDLTDNERKKLIISLHAGAVGGWDWDALSAWDIKEMADMGFDKEMVAILKADKQNIMTAITRAEIAKIEDSGGYVRGAGMRKTEKQLVCPYCGHEWEVSGFDE